ncbi:transcription termination factor MTERF2, chloroplastic-like [Macadamia integrifolia]|uniref:transcription termination factor MTERF2, chloroplastic-like n=1 Tax=Macadamia integrifolia TaxID=60698 RepID=UPI001C4EBBE9|nr:transcription termination factor MTERF2, chloroplastic-like [Macadamia integrifolia]XP_042488853.1 transcription termination factor MTERF2, chloroplastic-like [Macadamia integrifolia]XP_042488855.1 transcription termination factor MTERF2, chloroplastic-like [Macadamia integrifolia]XP_042488856.1 transcription termination factor MTERF2, chloroplastic-like [Macadamia integrifolia]XP_042488857.1 transcription termination factor MTERF2, chloroplastic-like [Macadamia integrifolia]XP_042488858.1 
MYGLLVRWFSQLRSTGDPLPNLYLLRVSYLRFNSDATNQPSLTVDYLVNSCGLSPESALKASKIIDLKTTTKSDSVLALFRNYGFSQPEISNIISNHPAVLRADPEKVLNPKIELLCNIGVSGPCLAKILSRFSNFLSVSLEKELIPSLDFLKSFVHKNEKIALTLSRLRWNSRLPEIMGPNIEILRNHGVPESSISRLIILQPRLLTWKAERFKKIVVEVKEMGLDPKHSSFINAVRTLAGLKKTLWEEKFAVFQSFGWSEDLILSLFRKQPSIFSISEKGIRERLVYFMNELNWAVGDLLKRPAVLQYSMEKRILPRYSVLQVLITKDLVKKQSVGGAFLLTEDKFLDRFVNKYLSKQPHLLKVYQSVYEEEG